MTDEYKAMLRDCIELNVRRKPALLDIMRDRMGVAQIEVLERERFADFFKIGIRKLLVDILLDGDWYVDPDEGIKTYEFSRPFDGGEYTMLHFVMDVKRQVPDANHRAPNSKAPAALDASAAVVDGLFAEAPVRVTDDIANAATLNPTLDQIRARRVKYYPEPT